MEFKKGSLQNWIAINGTFALLVILGTIFNIAWAANLAIFATIILGLISIVFSKPDFTELILTEDPNWKEPLPRKYDILFDMSIFILFIANSFFIMGVIYLYHMYQSDILYNNLRKAQEE